jgi:hypothetical protein
LKVEEAFREDIEVREIVGGKNFPLDNREVDLDLIEPTGMNRRMHERKARIESPQALNSFGAAMDRAVIHDPKDATSVVVGRTGHHLFDQSVKGRDPILGLAAAENSGVVNV